MKQKKDKEKILVKRQEKFTIAPEEPRVHSTFPNQK